VFLEARLERALRDRLERLPAGLRPRLPRDERIVFIDNPRSGGGTYAAYAEWARQLYNFLGYDVRLLSTERPGHAAELAQRAAAEGATLIVVCSGDGGVRDSVAGLLALPEEKRPKLSVLPKGTANVLAKTFGLQVGPFPDFLHACFRQLYWARERPLDVGFLDDTAFACFAGFGFDADLIENVPERDKRLLKEWAYVFSGLRTLFGWNPAERRFRPYELPRMRVRGTDPEGRRLELYGYFVAVGNVRDYGSRLFPFMRNARPDDGLLDVVVVDTRDLLELLRIGQQVLARTHLRHPLVHSFQSREPLEVESLEHPVPMHVDCELLARESRCTLRLVPSALRILA
jgi:diacylglycerol kinase (ATP)